MPNSESNRTQNLLNSVLRGLSFFPALRLAAARLTRWRFLRRWAWFRRQYHRRMRYIMERNQLPEIMIIETTNRCNARCTMCPQPRMQRRQGIMEESLFQKIIGECAALGIRRVQLNATGEPLLDPRLPERLAFAKRSGIAEVSFFTNAFLLTAEKSRQILNAKPDVVVLSLDGYDASTYETLRGLPFETVKNNILDFLDQNLRQVGRVYTVVSTLAVKQTTTALARHSLYQKLLRLASKVVLIPMEEMHDWAGAIAGEGMGRDKVTVPRVPCRRLWSSFNVLWDGRVALCDMDYEGKHILGDMASQTIAEIWHSQSYQRIRTAHQDGDFAGLLLCRECREDVSWWKEHSEDQRKL